MTGPIRQPLDWEDEDQQGDMFFGAETPDTVLTLPLQQRDDAEVDVANAPVALDVFRVRSMLRMAGEYADRNLLAEAQELVDEVVASRYDGEDLHVVQRRLQVLQEEAQERAKALQVADQALDEPFTRRLPGRSSLSPAVLRILLESDDDIDHQRHWSALDATLQMMALAPAYVPAWIRLAELRVALGQEQLARTTLLELRSIVGDDAEDNWLNLATRSLLDPDDVDVQIKLARAVLRTGNIELMDAYVSPAITQVLDSRPRLALELADAFSSARPDAASARTLRLRALVANGRADDALAMLGSVGSGTVTSDVMLVKAAAALAEGRDAWLAALEEASVATQQESGHIEEIRRAIAAAAALIPPREAAITTGVALFAAGDVAGAAQAFTADLAAQSDNHPDTAFVAAVGHALCLQRLHPQESIEPLTVAIGQAVVLDVRPYAEQTRIFPAPVSAEALMQELVSTARTTEQVPDAVEQLMILRDRLPEHLEIRSGLAELMITHGRVTEGVRELRYIAERHERAGDMPRMVNAMQRMSAAVPTNANVKAKLIEGFLARGIPEEAMRELRLLGELQVQRGRGEEAAQAFARGAEIAQTLMNVRTALDLFDRAVDADPTNLAVRHAAVAGCITAGQAERAVTQLREIVRLSLAADDPDEAIASLHQMIALGPSDASAYHQLGEVLTSVGEYQQARRVYARLAQMTPNDPVLAAKQSALAALAAMSEGQ